MAMLTFLTAFLTTKTIQNFASYFEWQKPFKKCHSKLFWSLKGHFYQQNTVQNTVFVIKNSIFKSILLLKTPFCHLNFNDKRLFPFRKQSHYE